MDNYSTAAPRRLAIFGSTGSIGTQTLDVVSQHPDLFAVEVLSAYSSVELLASQAVRFGAKHAVICNEKLYGELCRLLEGTGVTAHSGMDAVCSLAALDTVDTVVAAMVGFSGLRSTVAALKAGKSVALANKETLVAAGAIVTELVRSNGHPILPVDSEHSAIFQCLQCSPGEKLVKIHLTASGGPFRSWDKERIAAATVENALNHPNWKMGAKITVDSATMLNKGLELIEAKWLFDVEPDQINIVVHPQSIIHSMVEYEDGAVIAQLGCPDMREPIQYALTYPARKALNNKKLDFAALGHLDFFAPDYDKFPCLSLAFESIRRGGSAPATMNAANEVAVAAFLEGRTTFYGIADIIEKTLDGVDFAANPSLDDIYRINDEAAAYARTLIK